MSLLKSLDAFEKYMETNTRVLNQMQLTMQTLSESIMDLRERMRKMEEKMKNG